LGPEQTFTHESSIGTTFRGRIVGEALLSAPHAPVPGSHSDMPTAILPEIEGEAFITGESTFQFDERDPLRYGFRL
ncbi:MAG TPA: proline racemase family protein, partial [Longimicrobiaceae bacterium]|nr:proline racemase family protein [Longimicrobiaceae bacterium]